MNLETYDTTASNFVENEIRQREIISLLNEFHKTQKIRGPEHL